MTPAGLVITGGASLLRGTDALASEILKLPVRLGEPDLLNGLSDVIDNPVYIKKDGKVPKAIFSTAVGLVEYGARYHKNSGEKSKDVVGDFINKIKRFFEWF